MKDANYALKPLNQVYAQRIVDDLLREAAEKQRYNSEAARTTLYQLEKQFNREKKYGLWEKVAYGTELLKQQQYRQQKNQNEESSKKNKEGKENTTIREEYQPIPITYSRDPVKKLTPTEMEEEIDRINIIL